MKLFNTKGRSLQEFKPLHENEVKMYVCGPTVYDNIHVGNARPMIVFDVLRRYLLYRGYDVTFVQNYTDIDDKMILRANEQGITVKAMAKRFIGDYEEDAEGLNVMQPDVKPRATEHIKEIIQLVRTLEAKGLAYQTEDGVYFDTDNHKPYGKLSGRDLDDLKAGARIAVDEKKKNPMDFALWKKEKPGEPSWGSPWGKGRPGWHIECSAMSMKYLGETFDIHGGGVDLVFPHHENEVAQSEGATGQTFVNYWLHNGYINIDNKKMSKSLGNFFTVRDIAKEFDLEVLRFFMLSVHYRSPVNFSSDLMKQAESGLKRLYNARSNWNEMAGEGDISETMDERIKSLKESFNQAMDNDINSADALGHIYEFVRFSNVYLQEEGNGADAKAAMDTLVELAGVLGLLYREEAEIPEEITVLLALRKEAREQKNWSESDRLRDEIKSLGYSVEDSKDGQKVKKI